MADVVDIWGQLRARYCAPEWAIFFEVANGLGADHRRYADAVAMSLFPSRGLDVHGFELKSSRSDWLRELKDPKKADMIAKYCDFWWLVTADEKVADKNEVPRSWGLLVSNGKELRQVKRAERMKAKPIDRSFLGAVLRRADQHLAAELKNDSRVVAAREQGHQEGLAERDWKIKDSAEDLAKVQRQIKEFEEASGLALTSWNAGNVGEGVKAFMKARQYDASVTDRMERTAGWIEEMARGLRDQVALIKGAQEEAPAPVAAAAQDPGPLASPV